MAKTMPPPADSLEQAHPETTVELLQRLLAAAIHGRALILDLLVETENRGSDRHWFCPGDDDYCLACNLPANNARHVPRPGAA